MWFVLVVGFWGGGGAIRAGWGAFVAREADIPRDEPLRIVLTARIILRRSFCDQVFLHPLKAKKTQRQQQIPYGDDNQKDKDKSRLFFRLVTTTKRSQNLYRVWAFSRRTRRARCSAWISVICLSFIMPVRAMPRDSRMLRLAMKAASSQPWAGEKG